MELKVNDKIGSFIVTRIREVVSLEGTLIEMKEEHTGSELCWLKRKDVNKTFMVGFKTLPKDDTGVFHILEHSVLNGSAKYPVKEPFVELLKGSMQTFLNAMTFPDKTVYPVSSKNEKDYLNLVDVYLDAVFAPLTLKHDKVFKQEGWHLELFDKEEKASYKGVVFNEMKGAMQSSDEIVMDAMNKLLFADTPYRYNSGGDPVHIPELTYESYVEQYHQFYQFANAKFFLDGDLPIEEVINKILGYCPETVIEVNDVIPYQEEKTGLSTTVYYPVSSEEEMEKHDQFMFGKILCKFDDKEKIYAWSILSDVLAGNNESPLKKAVLDKKLAENIAFGLMDSTQQPWLYLQVENSEKEKLEEIKDTLKNVFVEQAKGINRESLLASLNRFEFNNKERGGSWAPEGIMLGIVSFDSWLYGGDPIMYLESKGVFESLKAKMDEGYFESLIQDVLDSLDKVALVTALPSVTLTEEQNQAEAERAQALKDTYSDEALSQLIEENKVLVEWQQTPNTKEELESIPQLKKEDVNPYPEKVNYTVEVKDGVTYINHETTPSGISYFNMYFSLADYAIEDYNKLAFFTSCMGALPTAKYSAAELMTKIKMYLGGFGVAIATYTKKDELDTCAPYLAVYSSFLDENKDEALALIKEILFNTDFNRPKELKDMLSQRYTGRQQAIMARANMYAKTRLLGAYSAKGRINEEINGYSYYRWLKKKNKYFDEDIDGLIKFFSEVKNNFTSMDMVVSSNGLSGLEEYVSTFDKGEKKNLRVAYPLLNKESLGVEIPSGVSYAGLGGNFLRLGDKYDYGMRVLNKIMTLEYLWVEVRVKNGAYGVAFNADDDGNVAYTSFRDPNGNNSLNVYRKSAEFIRSFAASNEDVERFMIGAISDCDTVLDNKTRILLGDSCYFGDITYEERCDIRRGILNFKKEDLYRYADILDKIIDGNHIVIFGSKQMSEKEGLESIKL